MQKMLLVMNRLDLGGIEKAVVNLLNCISPTEWEIDLYLVRKEGVFLKDIPKNVNVYEIIMPEYIRTMILLPTRAALKESLQHGKVIAAGKILGNYLKRYGGDMNRNMEVYFEEYDRCIPMLEKRYDVAIDYQGQGSFPTYYVAQKVMAENKISWIHNDFSVVDDSLRWLDELYGKFNKIVSVSRKAEKAFVEKFPNKSAYSYVCYNIVPKKQICRLANEYEIPRTGEVIITTVGRLCYQKGYDMALNVLKKIKDQGQLFKYYIVGDGTDYCNLQKQVKRLGLEKYVVFTGFQNNPYPYIKVCDIYFQPSRFEGFCITLTEAKILGKAIVTTDFAGADEQIIDGKTGLIIAAREDEMYQALVRVLTDEHLKNTLEKNVCEQNINNDAIDQFYRLVEER